MVTPAQVGLTLNAAATAQMAQYHGRGDGAWFAALFGDSIDPVAKIDRQAAETGIKNLVKTVEVPATNATIRIVDGGEVVMIPAVNGKALDIAATLEKLASAPGHEMADGALDLVMVQTKPTVPDASGLVAQARRLLASPLMINAFDAIQNQTVAWTVQKDQWGDWLTTQNGPSGPIFTLDTNELTKYLNKQNQLYKDGRHIDVAKGVAAAQKAISIGQTSTTVQVLHNPTKYTIEPGDTIGSVAWAHGVPMWRISNANPGLNMDALNPGQEITIPSLDDMLPLAVVPNKRIVVSISKQHLWVYENGTIKWDWIASTGIPDSPTAPGIFQVQSHEENAYAGNWNLWMPHFMGIYEAVPNFMNGIHGFPTRNGAGILWENSLGHKVTYGCILISSTNATSLYNWAEDGVVVEIQA
jgi:lipoprotein-anchoring transpeptidase ErfK/SrfK